MNKNRTYFGALEVIVKILLGSKDLNIFKLYTLKKDYFYFYYEKLSWSRMQREIIMIKTLFNTLDQNIVIISNYICLRFELIVFEKWIN
jgi:hypothetical protein